MGAVTEVASKLFSVSGSASGIVSYTISGLGWTPDGVMGYLCSGSSLDTAIDSAVLGMGFCDGTRQQAVGVNSLHGQSSVDSLRWIDDDFTLKSHSSTSSVMGLDGVTHASAGAVSNGWQFNHVQGASSPDDFYILLVFFRGTDVYVSSDLDSVTTNSSVVDTGGSSFQPNVSFWANIANNESDSFNTVAALSQGVSFDTGAGVSNFASVYTSVDGNADGESDARVDTSDSNLQLYNGSLAWQSDVTAYTSTGFTKTNGGGGDRIVGFHINTSLDFKAGVADSPTTAASDWDESSELGFEPQLLGMYLGMVTAIDTSFNKTSACGVAGVAVADFNNSTESMISIADEQSSATTDTQSLASESFINLAGHDGTQEFDISSLTAEANGWKVTAANIADANSTARKWIYWAFGVAAVSGTRPQNPFGHPFQGPFAGPIG